MDAILSLVPESAYPELEKHLKAWLHKVSAKVDHTAQRERNAAMWKRRLDALSFLCRKVAALPDDEAIAAICAGPVEVPCVEVAAFHLALARRTLKAEARDKRNRRIAILARKGKTNADIARAVGVSYSTAAKVAAAALKGEKP